MNTDTALAAAEEALRESKKNYDSENFYASFFHAKEALEYSLFFLYLKKFKKEPRTKDPVFLLRDTDPPQAIKDLCNRVLEPYHPNRLHSPRTTGELLDAVHTVLAYVKAFHSP